MPSLFCIIWLKGDRLYRRYHFAPGRGSAWLGMRGASALFLTLAVLGLAGCGVEPFHLDLPSADGRDGGGAVPSYDSLMRIAAAARGGGDLVNALGVYRRAAEIAPLNPAPLVGAGDVLLEMGSVNEAIVNYNNALFRDQQCQPALVGLARAFLKSGKPALALDPLGKAYALSPDDPKVLLLFGVAKDISGEHSEAQAWYRRCPERSGTDRQSRFVACVEWRLSRVDSDLTAVGSGARRIAAGAADPCADLRIERKRRGGGPDQSDR